MKIVSTNIYVGPNIYAHFPVIRHVLDLEALEDWPTGRLGGFDETILYDAPLAVAMRYLEKNLVRKALAQANWNKSKTARYLGLSRQGLLKKIKRYGISREHLGVPLEDTP